MGLHVFMSTPTPAARHPEMHLPDVLLPFAHLSPPSSTCYAKSQHPNKGSMQALPFVSTPRRPCKTTNAYKAHLLMSSGLDCPPKTFSQRRNCQSENCTLVISKMQGQSVLFIKVSCLSCPKLSTTWKAR